MSYQVLARKWRPRSFAELVGQEHVARALINALDGDRLHHGFLFAGTRGVGKTTIARILAKCLNCETGTTSVPCGECGACREIDEGRFIDLIEVDAASRAKVDETRELLENVQYAPARGRYKVYLIDEVHMFSKHSFNALLKTLEEPPPHVKFLLATTDPQKLPITVLSRCLQFNLRRIPVADIQSHLTRLLAAEEVTADGPAIRLVAEAADGSMRDGLSLLDQAIAYGAGALREADVRAMLGRVDKGRVPELLEALARQDGTVLMAAIGEMAAHAADFAEVLAEVIGGLQRVAVAQIVPDALEDDSDSAAAARALAREISPEDVQLYYQIGVMGRRDLPFAPDPRAGFEMIMLRMLAFTMAPAGPRAAGAARPDGAANSPAPAAKRDREPSSGAAGPVVPATSIDVESWPRVVDALPLTGLTRELGANSVLTGIEGDVVRLQLSPAHEQLLGPGPREKLAAALGDRLGRSVRVVIEIKDPSVQSPAQIRERDLETRQQAAIAALESDPVVQAIQSRFDARIDEDSVQPIDADPPVDRRRAE